MSNITLEIRITRSESLEPGKTYLVSASAIMPRAPVKPALSAFTMHSEEVEQRLHQILLDWKLRETSVFERQAMHAKNFGVELFDYLFHSEVEHLYYEIKARAVQQQSAIRLRLQIVPAELRTLPWELLHDNEQYLCISSHPKIWFARVPDTIVKKRALAYNPPLRLLGMAASPHWQDMLNLETEKRYIDTALDGLIQEQRVYIEWQEAEISALSDLRIGDPWHVFHFIGHGYFDNKENEEAKLIFEDAKRRGGYFVDADRLHLALHKDIQLVFLSACETARGDPLDHLSKFAYKLAISGTPAIVTMQFKITDAAAMQFTRFFYESVARGDAVDEAVSKARHHIFISASASPLEWMAPLLYISTSSSILFKDVKQDVTAVSADQSSPKTKEQWILEGKEHYNVHQYNKALVAYRKALDLDSDDELVREMVGRTLMRLGIYDEALTYYDDLLRISPSASTYLFKGLVLECMGKETQALEAYQKARESGY